MAVKIEKNIVGFNVVRPEAETPVEAEPKVEADVVQHMNENVERTEMLFGSTYKLKTPLSEHALYVTINDMVLNP
ncbi:MAG: NrdJb, partial [Gammaproteobacteria bacterium]|nr:NrdJb [Gammaproteobacteria bacterium]